MCPVLCFSLPFFLSRPLFRPAFVSSPSFSLHVFRSFLRLLLLFSLCFLPVLAGLYSERHRCHRTSRDARRFARSSSNHQDDSIHSHRGTEKTPRKQKAPTRNAPGGAEPGYAFVSLVAALQSLRLFLSSRSLSRSASPPATSNRTTALVCALLQSGARAMLLSSFSPCRFCLVSLFPKKKDTLCTRRKQRTVSVVSSGSLQNCPSVSTID